MTDPATTRTDPFAFVRDLASRWDVIAIIVVIGVLTFFAEASRGLLAPVSKITGETLSLDPVHLPVYAARTTLRMFTALIVSLLFTFTYATWAAKSPRAGKAAGAAARHPAVGADPRLPLGDAGVLHVAGAGARARARSSPRCS